VPVVGLQDWQGGHVFGTHSPLLLQVAHDPQLSRQVLDVVSQVWQAVQPPVQVFVDGLHVWQLVQPPVH
jgi:hypothetical protein